MVGVIGQHEARYIPHVLELQPALEQRKGGWAAREIKYCFFLMALRF